MTLLPCMVLQVGFALGKLEDFFLNFMFSCSVTKNPQDSIVDLKVAQQIILRL